DCLEGVSGGMVEQCGADTFSSVRGMRCDVLESSDATFAFEVQTEASHQFIVKKRSPPIATAFRAHSSIPVHLRLFECPETIAEAAFKAGPNLKLRGRQPIALVRNTSNL